MDTIRICKQCQKPLPQNAPEGLCPECLARVALGSEPAVPGTRVPPAPDTLAAQFPQLEILELLGMGGMGMVYKARQPRLDRFVALKILPIASMPDASFGERFEREAKALAKLNHPGIVAVYDFGQTKEYYYFIMEFVDGMNLRQLIQAKTLEPRQALELVTQICTALQFAHDEKIVHRDIKPENILITKKGQVKIADFGLAKLLGGKPDTALTASQMVMGTLNYMAPEQRENTKDVDHRADIYSLGVVFYEMLTGEVPMGRFDAPSKKVQIDVRLDEVVLHALEREPARRYQRVSEVKSSVETITGTTPAGPAVSPAAPVSAIPQPTFAKLVGKPMVIALLVWLASLIFAWIWPSLLGVSFFLGVGMLIGGLPTGLFNWRCKVAGCGLHWRQLPPAVRRRSYKRIIPMAAGCVAAFFIGSAVFPSRWTEWREESFYPKSHAYEKLVLSGNITGYQTPAWSKHTPAGYGTMALKIYRKDSAPAALTFTLPGMRLENVSQDPGQSPVVRVLTLDVLTNWLHDSVGLDVAEPQVKSEARQLMELFKPYYDGVPSSWEELNTKARTSLGDFNLAEVKMNFGQRGIFGWQFFIWEVAPGVCLCLFYFIAFPSVKRAFAEGCAEIAAGRWTSPEVVVLRIPIAFWVLFTLGFLIALFAITGQLPVKTGVFVAILIGILMSVVLKLQSRRQTQEYYSRQIQKARERGLWPQLGEQPTVEHVKSLAQAGEKILAVRLYHQIHNVSCKDAKAAVQKLVEH